ncbi:molybdopterin molybdotransferase MoeA [soil metagenome]
MSTADQEPYPTTPEHDAGVNQPADGGDGGHDGQEVAPAEGGAPAAPTGGDEAGHGPASDLVPLPEQLQRIVESVQPLAPIQLSLLDTAGCALAADVVAAENIPPFDNSAMDGYAVVADALDGWLPVTGEVAAGDEPRVRVEAGTAVRIMTGAALPAGTTAVVPVELVEEDGDRIRVRQPPEPGAHIRKAGESVAADETVLVAGTVLDAASIGMLAALGHSYVSVFPHPRVVIVSTGDELSEPGGERPPGAIYDANSYVLTVLARESGAQTVRRMIPSDDKAQLRETIEELLPHADLLVTTGGVSAGKYDLVKVVLAELGDVEFHKIGMRPGMPQAFGFIEADPGRVIPCFGLPGNPVSAYVSFEVFVRPTIRRMQGRRDLSRPRISAALEAPIESVADKVEFVRVTLRRRDGEWQARPTGAQGSGILRSLVEADGLAEVPVDRERLDIGERAVVHLLRSV